MDAGDGGFVDFRQVHRKDDVGCRADPVVCTSAGANPRQLKLAQLSQAFVAEWIEFVDRDE
nr:hypothetical protein [Streptomyces sp. DSM 41633]